MLVPSMIMAMVMSLHFPITSPPGNEFVRKSNFLAIMRNEFDCNPSDSLDIFGNSFSHSTFHGSSIADGPLRRHANLDVDEEVLAGFDTLDATNRCVGKGAGLQCFFGSL
jgi:hypothetical protein